MTQPMPLPILSRPSRQSLETAELALTLLGPSAAMARLWSQMRRLAPHLRAVLLTGEPDCGQEAVARLLLDLSPGNQRSFIRLTAAEAETRLSRPAALLAFPSDALVFLPDIERLPRTAQDALLRLMKMRRARPFTVVAATKEDLRGLVAVGRFSQELADALTGMQMSLPSLRDRAEDLPMLIGHLLTARAGRSHRPTPQLSEDFLRSAIAYAWPGNLLELSEVLGTLCSETNGDPLQGADLHRALASQRPKRLPEAEPVRMVSVETVVREHIVAVLRACRGNKLRAAEVLGISRSTLYRTLDSVTSGEEGQLPLAS